MSFRIEYANPNPRLRPPEDRASHYDLVDAIYDYRPEGISATVIIGPYRLKNGTGRLFSGFVTGAQDLADGLKGMRPSPPGDDTGVLPGLPEAFQIYNLLLPEWMEDLPNILFASDGTAVWIYTRSSVRDDDAAILPGRDLVDPVITTRAAVLTELADFLTRYLDDLVASFTFLEKDAVYKEWREAIAGYRRP
jgi:hypothetical protein